MGHSLAMSTIRIIWSLHELGWSERKIALELNLNRKTIRPALEKKNAVDQTGSTQTSQSKCLPYQKLIEDKIA